MQRVSTNITIFLKLLIPTFWIAFFGAFSFAVWISDVQVGRIPSRIFKPLFTAFYLGGIAILYWSVMRLKRVEMDEHFVYATNYFKHYRYPYHNIEEIEEQDFFFINVVHIHLKEAGNFGKKITFLPSKRKFQAFLNANPEVVKTLMNKEEKE